MTEEKLLMSSVQEEFQIVILFSFAFWVWTDFEDIDRALLEVIGQGWYT
jgi:hypothetical protein